MARILIKTKLFLLEFYQNFFMLDRLSKDINYLVYYHTFTSL